ncbi:hypothetical protein GCM10025771_35780 [Niveibacterium umoris]|uniref:Phosphoglycerate mutase n=1 Tax=Niveibacterium umoris TaxID=1193620 RepID=A0A840BDQ5_9RHOO|nr:hypothetical protein [Niveibacterium umoris]MBB4011225.1 hypothetical protein [Niveibacterium umoris]
MHATIVLPGLRYEAPDAISALRSISLPGLSWLVGHSRLSTGTTSTSTRAFASTFGMQKAGTAVLRRAGEAGLPLPQAGEIWLCADPVGLHFARDQMILTDPRTLALSQDETVALGSALRVALKDVGDFTLVTPERGYLKLREPAQVRFSDLLDVAGRPVALFLPEGDDTKRWGRIVNEVQVSLHDHPVNRARENTGSRLVNSLWFWGEGPLEGEAKSTAARVFSDNPVGSGLARLAGKDAAPLTEFATTPADGDSLLLIDALDAPARFRDTTRWLDALIVLEAQLFAPLAAQMQRREIKQARITAPGERSGIELAVATPSWAFWLKPKSPELLLAPLPNAS